MFQKKKIGLLLSLIMLLTVFISGFAGVYAAEAPVHIVIAHTNDMHGRIEEGKYDGMGLAKVTALVDELRAENDNVLFFDAGDAFHGQPIATIFEGESMVEIMNMAGYDLMVPGNHDFNYGKERLVELKDMAGFEIVSANIFTEADEAFINPYKIFDIEGVKIGVFGLSTPETKFKSHPNNTIGLEFRDPSEVAQTMVDELDDEVDIIVALAHLGLDDTYGLTSEKVAMDVDGIDLIIDGHSHDKLLEGMMVNDTLIVQAGEYDKNLGVVEIDFMDGEAEITASLLEKENVTIEGDAEISALVDEIKVEYHELVSPVVGTTSFVLDGERDQVRKSETNLGNLLVDSMLDATGADFAMTNGGGIRSSIDIGDITIEEIITVLPFGNTVIVKPLSGMEVKEALENGATDYPELKGAFTHVANVKYQIDVEKPAGSRIMNIMINGVPLDMNATYEVATNDFIAAGGDGYTMFDGKKELMLLGGMDEILMDYIEANGTEGAMVEGRIVEYVPVPVEVPMVANTYVVKSGDMLWKIGKQFGIAWQTLAEFNKMNNPHLIFPGQKVLIPAQ
jgi:5'-nucleotidase